MSIELRLLTRAAFAAPLRPLFTRGCLWVWYGNVVREELKDEARDEEQHRSASLAIAGFSLSLFSAFVIVDHAVNVDLEIVIYFAGWSFVAYFAAYALQMDKPHLLADQFGDAAMDSGSLCLILSLMGLLIARQTVGLPSCILIVAAIGVWLFEHVQRLRLTYRYLSLLQRRSHGRS